MTVGVGVGCTIGAGVRTAATCCGRAGVFFRAGSVYGAIAAPVAVMYWVYVTVLSLMLGAAFNGALAIRRGWFVRPQDAPDRDDAPAARAVDEG